MLQKKKLVHPNHHGKAPQAHKKKLVHPNHHGKAPQAHKGESKDLLDLEENSSSFSASSLQSKLLFCKNDDFLRPPLTKSECVAVPDKKPNMCAIPESNVLGKVKDFLGVISEANKRLQFDSMGNSEKYDIEILNGDESEYIEMDLMLGVADLHTPEAVAAAESAMAGYQPTIPSAAGSSNDDDESDDGNSEDDEESDGGHDEEKTSKAASENGISSTKASRNQPSKKRPKIVELS